MKFYLISLDSSTTSIVIKPDTMEEEIYLTEPKYDIPLLLANIGGQLGLFTGFSVLTGVEILELFTDLCQTLACRMVTNFWGARVLPFGGPAGEMA